MLVLKGGGSNGNGGEREKDRKILIEDSGLLSFRSQDWLNSGRKGRKAR